MKATYSKDELIGIGVQKLKSFGFVYVNKTNVLEDEVYVYHFKKFMFSLLGRTPELDQSINQLLATIDNKNEAH